MVDTAHLSLNSTLMSAQKARIRSASRRHAAVSASTCLDALVGTLGPDIDAALEAVEARSVQFREELLLGTLLEAQTSLVRQAIALASVYEIAVPVEAILALSPERPIHDDVDTAVDVGLLQAGLHPTTGELRYLVSPLVRPLLEQLPERLDSAAFHEAQARAARLLYRLWVDPDAE